MKYSIIIGTYNHCDDLLKPCLESLFKYTNLEQTEIVVVANGCVDNTKEYLESCGSKIRYIWKDEAQGYTKAMNLGINAAKGEYIVLLNNDTEVLPSPQNAWLDILEQPFIAQPKTGITGPLVLYDTDVNSHFVVFWCAMIPKKLFDEIGLLDEIFNPGYGEDIDFAMRCKAAGYAVTGVCDIKVENGNNTGSFPMVHKNNKTFGEISDYSTVIVKRNKKILQNKYHKIDEKISKFKVAVITPLYNDEKFIKNALDSVENQTFQNVTHYVYDDCSVDNGRDIVANYKTTKKIDLTRGIVNQGQSHARNVMIQKAIEDGCTHVAFLDADDKWNCDHLETSLLSLDNNDVVYSLPSFAFENGQPAFPNFVVPREFIGKHLRHNNFIWISSVVAKIQCFENNKFDSSLNSVEDWDMWCRLYEQNYQFVYKKHTSITYIVKPNGSAAQGSNKLAMLAQKHDFLPKLKLHLACGHDYDPSYINIDLYAPDDARVDFRHDVRKLPYDDNTVDEIKAFHIIEHFDFFEGQEVLKEWYRVLKPGGKLYLETPDFLETCRAFVEADEEFRIVLYGHFFAHPWVAGQTHKFLFTESQLRSQLSWVNFKNVIRVKPASKYVLPNTIKLFLTVEAYK